MDRHYLWVLMKKNIVKSKIHFGEKPWIFNKIDSDYEKLLIKQVGKEESVKVLEIKKMNYGKFK
jgi:hypothetical protein